MTEVEAKVKESSPRDYGRKIIRISQKLMKELGISTGDFVEVEGSKGTSILQVWPLIGEDGNIVSIDGLVRSMIGVSVGDTVRIRKVEVQPAQKIVLAPVLDTGEKVVLRGLAEYADVIRENIVGKPFKKGESFIFPFISRELRFIVTTTVPATNVYVTPETEVIIKEETVAPEEARSVPRVTWEDIGDLEEAKQKLREMIEWPLKRPELFKHLGIEPPKGVLLYGPPGVGKTLLAKALANEIGASFYSINGPEIMSKFYGESEQRLREIFEEAEKNAPSIIFIDEIDSIAPKREEVTGEVEKRVVAQLLTLMDGIKGRGRVIVIGATNRPEAVDPALRRPGRFDREIYIHPPDTKARKEILLVHTRSMPLAEDVDLDKIADMTHGYTGADLAALAREAAMVALRRFIETKKIDLTRPLPPDVLKELKVTFNDFLVAMKNIQPSLIREIYVETPTVRWEDIGGLEHVKQALREAIEIPMKHPEIYEKMGINQPKGILLFGPPGTGKTLVAKAVATESGANFIAVRGPEVLSKWVGESERAIREIFKRARMVAPAVIFFDEIDSIATARGFRMDSSGVTDRIVNQLLTEMDGIQPLQRVVVIAATNRPDLLDPALLRPGRFDKIIYVPPPDKRARLQILKIHTRRTPLARDVDLEKLAEMTEGYTGADLEALVREAVLIALREKLEVRPVELGHFMEALKVVKPSLTREDIERYERIAAQLKRMVA
jgi:transitional endoplasmic reticulum ATPase